MSGLDAGERDAATLEEVARIAGVSRSTVSRVVNNAPGVSPRARAAVVEAIAATRYVPNQVARNLATRRTNTVALVVSEDGERVFGDPFFAGVLRGVSATLADADRQLVLMMSHGGDHERLEQYLAAGHVDGAVVVSLHGMDPMPQRLADSGVAVVLLGRPLAATTVAHVDADNLGGALAATRHLAATGRTRIGTIAGPQDMGAGIDRLLGWRRAMGELGHRTDAVAHADFTVEAGAAAMATLLAGHPDLDAVFAAADLLAVGALRHLTAEGIRVPDDIALVGFDDSVLATTTTPRLTTVRQPVEELGRTTAWRLLAQLSGEENLPLSMLLPTELVVRESS